MWHLEAGTVVGMVVQSRTQSLLPTLPCVMGQRIKSIASQVPVEKGTGWDRRGLASTIGKVRKDIPLTLTQ